MEHFIEILKSSYGYSNYLKWYSSLINKKISKSTSDEYTEMHHILPKSLFPEYKDDKNNLVQLSLREHFVAHLLLWKITKDSKMALAVFLMSQNNIMTINNSRMFETIRSNMFTSKGMVWIHKGDVRKYVPADDVNKQLELGWSLGMYDVKCTWVYKDNLRKMIRINQLNEHLDNDWKLGFSHNYIWVNKNGKAEFIDSSELDSWLDDGWTKGIGFGTTSNKIMMNKDGARCFIDNSDKNSYISMGWDVGTDLTHRHLGKRKIQKGELIKFVEESDLENMLSNGWSLAEFGLEGKRWINNGVREQPILDTDVIPKGWRSGRLSSKKQGSVYMNDGARNKMVNQSDADAYLSKGWKFGMLRFKTDRLIPINKDGVKTRVPENEVEKYINDGWNRGTGCKGNKNVNMILDGVVKSIPVEKREEYEKLGWKTLSSMSNWIKKDGKRKFIRKDETQPYLNDGWVYGR